MERSTNSPVTPSATSIHSSQPNTPHTGAPSTSARRRRSCRASTAPPSDRRLRTGGLSPPAASASAAGAGARSQPSRARAVCSGSRVPRVSHQLAVRSAAATSACVTTAEESAVRLPGAKAAAMVACSSTSCRLYTR
jgi:hypothetical protein